MPDEIKIPKEVEIFFEEDPNYKLIAANGMWGGVTTKADFRLDFFVESVGVPESIKHRVTPEGIIGDEISRNPPPKIVRQLQVGILLSVDNAEAMANFIKDRVTEFRKLQQKAK